MCYAWWSYIFNVVESVNLYFFLDDICMMFKVTYSERGSDNQLKEEATYIMFRQYMQRCAGMHCIFDCV